MRSNPIKTLINHRNITRGNVRLIVYVRPYKRSRKKKQLFDIFPRVLSFLGIILDSSEHHYPQYIEGKILSMFDDINVLYCNHGTYIRW